MNGLNDYMAIPKKKFWELVKKEGESAEARFKELWTQLDEAPLSQEDAVECLNALFIFTHKRILAYNKGLAADYPTKQFTEKRLVPQEELWWMDHFTTGISRWSTLSWFSAKKRKKKNGKMGYAGACTHFVQGYHDYPFYIIPLMHGSWNEPQRNKDSISIETVNAGRLHQKDGKWHYWARKLPLKLVQELPPVRLDKPYRGCKAMQPFTVDQIINNIKLKRLIIAALPGRLEPHRMSQHTDWRAGKSDMGPLWPFDNCNAAAFGPEPIPELDFIQQADYENFLEDQGDVWDEVDGWDKEDESQNPSYGDETPTHDDDHDEDRVEKYSIKDIQLRLITKGANIVADGKFGPKTNRAVCQFQQDWNKQNPTDTLKVDGKPGPQTCKRLFK